MKIEFENYEDMRGFRTKQYKCPHCKIKNRRAYFSKSAIQKCGFNPQKSILWGITEEGLPCFKFFKNGRVLRFYNKNKKNEYSCAAVQVADFVADKFQGEFIVDELESGIFVLRLYGVKNEANKETD